MAFLRPFPMKEYHAQPRYRGEGFFQPQFDASDFLTSTLEALPFWGLEGYWDGEMPWKIPHVRYSGGVLKHLPECCQQKADSVQEKSMRGIEQNLELEIRRAFWHRTWRCRDGSLPSWFWSCFVALFPHYAPPCPMFWNGNAYPVPLYVGSMWPAIWFWSNRRL